MDQSRFDSITRLLAGGISRRAAAGIAAAGLLSVTRAAEPASAGRRPRKEGPCGDQTRKDNICTSDGDCCTGICSRKLGKKNRDAEGRCRCVRRGRTCEEDRNCCSRAGQQMVCIGGICGAACTALGQVCDAAGTACCAGVCGGAVGAEGPSREAPGSTTCCLAVGQAGCSANADCCGGAVGATTCVQGVCQNACLALRTPCDPSTDICCVGTCSPYGGAPGLERGPAPTACCFALGDTGCTDNADCCDADATCVQGQCQSN